MHTHQSLYDAVARHLLTQRAVSLMPNISGHASFNGCAYRGEGGLKCAIGALIPDDQYTPEFEGVDVSAAYDTAARLRAAAGIPEDAIVLAKTLQYVHDNQDPRGWHNYLKTVAADHGLSAAVLEEVLA